MFIRLSGALLICCLAGAYAQGNDPLTGLPVVPAAETTFAGKSYGFQPTQMPEGLVCKSRMKGDFYAILNMNVKERDLKLSAASSWYAAHLPGFKKMRGSAGDRSHIAFYNSDGTLVVIITGDRGRPEEDTNTYGIAYERYQPGLSEKTITSLTQGKIVCP